MKDLSPEDKKMYNLVNTQDVINFIEYEEGLTRDPDTAARIRTLLIKLGIWN